MPDFSRQFSTRDLIRVLVREGSTQSQAGTELLLIIHFRGVRPMDETRKNMKYQLTDEAIEWLKVNVNVWKEN